MYDAARALNSRGLAFAETLGLGPEVKLIPRVIIWPGSPLYSVCNTADLPTLMLPKLDYNNITAVCECQLNLENQDKVTQLFVLPCYLKQENKILGNLLTWHACVQR